MHKINWGKLQMLPGKVQSCDGLMLRCWVYFPGKELGGATLAVWDVCCLCNRSLQSKCWMLFLLLGKVKTLFGFFSVSKNLCKVNFWKAGDTCINTELLPLYFCWAAVSVAWVEGWYSFIVHVCTYLYKDAHTLKWTYLNEYVGGNICPLQVFKPEHQYL